MIDKKEIKVLDKGYVELVDYMGTDLSAIRAAKQSAGKEVIGSSNEDRKFIRDLMRWGHLTPFEFITVTFRVKAPLFIYRQWHRSRTWSFVERSARYTELPNEYYVPEESVVTFKDPTKSDKVTVYNIKNPDDWWDCITPEQLESAWDWGKDFEDEQEMSRNHYQKRLDSGMRKELARLNTTVSQYSEMYATTDLRNLFHFLKLRLNPAAQWEIRQYAQAILDLIRPLFPIAVEAFEDYCLNSINLSRLECDALFLTLSENKDLLELLIKNADEVFENKREKEEFISKCKKFLRED